MIIKLKDGVKYLKVMKIGIVKVGNSLKFGNSRYTTRSVDVAQSYFVGIVLKSSIKAYIFLNFIFSNNRNFEV
jgi:hypothetical protein